MIQEWDTVRVSGYCLSEDRFVYNAQGVVATAYNGPEHRGAEHRHEIKIWIDGVYPDTNKLWFDRRFARITLLSRDMPTFLSVYPERKVPR